MCGITKQAFSRNETNSQSAEAQHGEETERTVVVMNRMPVTGFYFLGIG